MAMVHADLPDAGRVSHFEIDAQLPTPDEKAALAGEPGPPSDANRYLTENHSQFGEIYYHGAGFATTCTLEDTYYQVLGFDTNGEANGAVPDHTSGHITVAVAGRYLIIFSVSARAGNADQYQFMVCYNDGPIAGTACQNIMAHRDVSVAARLGVVACPGICDLPAGATVELWVQNVDNAGRDIDIEHATLVVTQQIGGAA